ncbi:isoleucine-tRNA ligase [Tilletia horrida]|nr:isoleucine-tRNA ligase [Tilletia horrida]
MPLPPEDDIYQQSRKGMITATATTTTRRAGMRLRSAPLLLLPSRLPCVSCACRRGLLRLASTSASNPTPTTPRSDDEQRAAEKRFASTLFLPKTAFDIRANASVREPHFRDRTTTALYHWQAKHNKGPLFILHDGPPYANGSLHTGHAMNKILKDVINRYNVLAGNRVHYMPGWDCHGLPIELKATQSLQKDGKSAKTTVSEESIAPSTQSLDEAALKLRSTAARFALETIETQKAEFSHFGIMADWSKEHTYRTLDRSYEANQLQVFGQMARSGLIYRQYRPVYWSPSTKTALAEAELEYNEAHRSKSAYVRFQLDRVGPALRQALGDLIVGDGDVDLVVWTTTPWTLPANAAVAVHQDLEYVLVRSSGPEARPLLIGKDRLQAISELGLGRVPPKGQSRTPVGDLEVLATIPGGSLLDSSYRHPFLASTSLSRPILSAAFVTASSGTGLVHCAPAHGADDYELCRDQGLLARDGLFSPVDDDGRYTADVGIPRLVGLDVLGPGGREVMKMLDECGALLSEVPIVHKYPYDWRSKLPVITRATSQWFTNLDRIKASALKALESVTFFPPTGRNRLEAFIRSRSEWCISRQRAWGVPLPVIYDAETDEPLITDANVAHIARVLAERGTDHWWAGDVEEFVAPEHRAEGKKWRKGRDTVDVWFDSGVSWALLRGLRPQQPHADLYLEGSDQHRGWFQSSLLTAIAVAESTGAEPVAPFARIATHGFVVDEAGKKMSKSIGNVLSPLTIVQGEPKRGWPAYGTDVLRFWVAKSDYAADVPVGPTILKKAGEAMRKLRNSARFMLANLPAGGVGGGPSRWSRMDGDGDVSSPAVVADDLRVRVDEMSMADRHIMQELYRLEKACRAGYEAYDFAQVMRRVTEFASGPLSSLYLDITKDVLYADPADSARRQIILAVLDQVLRTFTSILAPVTPHLAEEIFHFYHGAEKDPEPGHDAGLVGSVFQHGWQGVDDCWNDTAFAVDMERLLKVRDAVLASLESARREGHIKGSLAAGVQLHGPSESTLLRLLQAKENELANFFIVSDVTVSDPSVAPPDQDPSAAWSLSSSVEDVQIVLRPAGGHKCPRCWTYRRLAEEEVCGRCGEALRNGA